MPAPLAVDWQEVKTITLLIGLEAAAERTGLNLNTLKARSAREDWFAERKAIVEGPARAREAIVQQAHATGATIVPTAAEILATLGPDSKSKLAIAGNKAVTLLSEMDADELVQPDVAQTAKTWAGTLAISHDWQQSGSSSVQTVVNIAFLSPPSHEDARSGLVVEQDGAEQP